MLLDSAGLYFRAYYAVPTSVTAPDGTPVNAVRGFLDMLASLVSTRRPDEVVACWDDDWRPAWRVALLPSYKTHRVAAPAAPTGTAVPAHSAGSDWIEDEPDELSPQVEIIADILAALGIPRIGAAHFEADDVIATLAHSCGSPERPVEVISGDRDLLQVVDDARNVRLVYTGRGMAKLVVFDEAEVRAHYGVPPQRYVDLAVLRGDPSDGLPGIPGVGAKTAASLLTSFPGVAALVAAARAGDPRIRRTVAANLAANEPYLNAAMLVVRAAETPVPPGPWPLPSAPADPDRLMGLAHRWGLQGPVGRVTAALAGEPLQPGG